MRDRQVKTGFVKRAIRGVAVVLAVMSTSLHAQAIRIGEIDSFLGVPQSGMAYRNGADLAIAELNASGGLLGRSVELIKRDDSGNPDDAVKHAQALIKDDHVDVLTGSMLSNVALAVAKTAASQKKVLIVGDALSDAITLDKGNRYTFRLRPSTYMLAAMLAETAVKMPARRWAIVAPNYEYGQSAVASFKLLLKERRPDVEFVAEQWPAMGKLRAIPVVRELLKARPDAIFNATFGNDLQQFAEEGARQGLFAGSAVLSMSSSDTLGSLLAQYENARKWTVLGYPEDQLTTEEHQRFREAYFKRFGERPLLPAIFGYSTIMSVAAAIRKAGTVDSEKVVAALRGLTVGTPLGPVLFRAQDQQSSMGAFIATLVFKDGRSSLVDWHYLDGTRYMPSASYIRGRRPSSAMR